MGKAWQNTKRDNRIRVGLTTPLGILFFKNDADGMALFEYALSECYVHLGLLVRMKLTGLCTKSGSGAADGRQRGIYPFGAFQKYDNQITESEESTIHFLSEMRRCRGLCSACCDIRTRPTPGRVSEALNAPQIARIPPSQ